MQAASQEASAKSNGKQQTREATHKVEGAIERILSTNKTGSEAQTEAELHANSKTFTVPSKITDSTCSQTDISTTSHFPLNYTLFARQRRAKRGSKNIKGVCKTKSQPRNRIPASKRSDSKERVTQLTVSSAKQCFNSIRLRSNHYPQFHLTSTAWHSFG